MIFNIHQHSLTSIGLHNLDPFLLERPCLVSALGITSSPASLQRFRYWPSSSCGRFLKHLRAQWLEAQCAGAKSLAGGTLCTVRTGRWPSVLVDATQSFKYLPTGQNSTAYCCPQHTSAGSIVKSILNSQSGVQSLSLATSSFIPPARLLIRSLDTMKGKDHHFTKYGSPETSHSQSSAPEDWRRKAESNENIRGLQLHFVDDGISI